MGSCDHERNAARKDTKAVSRVILFGDFVEESGMSTIRCHLIPRHLCLCKVRTNDTQTVPDSAAPAPDSITHMPHPHCVYCRAAQEVQNFT